MTKSNDIKIRAYMAGPDVFHPQAKENAEIVRDLCAKYGIVALIPLDNEVEFSQDKNKISTDIFQKNVELLNSADIVIANMTPFRGPSADVGTVWEIGFAYAKEKPIFAFTDDLRQYKERVVDYLDKVGNDGLAVEDFGNVDNTMIDKSVKDVKNKLLEVLESIPFKNSMFLIRKQKAEELIEKADLTNENNIVTVPRPAKTRSLKNM